MTLTPMQDAEGMHIGTVDFVSPDEIKVLLDIEAPESVALNAGRPRPFPRVNSYVLAQVDDGYLVGQIVWLTIERSAFPKRRGMQDFGLIDLPYPLRKMSMNPLGTLKKKGVAGNDYRFARGAEALPSVGASVVLPTDAQLRSIVESGERKRVQIGVSPLADNASVLVDPDRLFGRHLAILGNTGSGKSCSVAGIIRWSLEAAETQGGSRPNARFIVLDPNGEYAHAFRGPGFPEARVFKANPSDEESKLQVPLWFWNSTEWCSFMQASARAQRPLLKRTLRDLRSGQTSAQANSDVENRLRLRRYLSSTLISVQRHVAAGSLKDEATKFGKILRATYDDLEDKQSLCPECDLAPVLTALRDALLSTYKTFTKNGEVVEYYEAFSERKVNPILDALQTALQGLGGVTYQSGPDEDVPIPFDGLDLADHLEILAEQEGVSQYLDFLIARIRTFLADDRIKPIIGDTGSMTLQQWLEEYVGSGTGPDEPVSVIDLSLVPTEVIHIVAAVIARMVFEALQRYRMLNDSPLPTVLVMEEAHTFVRRYKDDSDNQDTASVCCQVFERIAREGRKFGLGLILSSQRPSELSPTVLSQCNTFLLHRVSNDSDQRLVRYLVPDNQEGLLRDLPTLPSQNAVLLGWATELPVLVRMRDLPKSHQPQSDDPDFWDVWTGKSPEGNKVERSADWVPVANDWQGLSEAEQTDAGDQDADDSSEAPATATPDGAPQRDA